MKRKIKAGIILLALVFAVNSLLCCSALAYDADQAKLDRDAVNTAITNARNEFNTPIANYGTTAAAQLTKYTNIRNYLDQALALVPYRTDLLHVKASTYYAYSMENVGNGMGTPTYSTDLINIYNKIIEVNPSDPKARFFLAYWNHYKLTAASAGSASTEHPTVKPHIDALAEVDPGKSAKLVDFLKYMESCFGPNAKPTSASFTADELTALGTGSEVAVITLGNALDTYAGMTADMLARLNKTAEIAKQLPDCKIIVTGGVPKYGTNEGVEMKKYLIGMGIAEDRISPENHSRNTPDNLIYALPLAEQFGVKKLIMISADTHVRRGGACIKAYAATQSYPFELFKIIPSNPTTAPNTNPTENASSMYGNAAVSFFDYAISF